MKIEIIGHVCLDNNISENTSYTAAGGPGTFMERVFKDFPDVDVEMAANYGPDLAPYLDVPIYPKSPNFSKSLHHQNISKMGTKKTIVENRDAALPPELTDALQDRIKDADIIFFTPLSPNLPPEYIKRVVELARQDCLKVLLPQGFFWNLDQEKAIVPRDFEEAAEIIPMLDIIVVGEQDSSGITQTAREWTIDNKLISIVTLGNKGAVAFEHGQEISLPTEPVAEKDIVDTVGSGDIFSASFAYKYKQTHDIVESGRFANEVAKQALFYPAEKIKIDLSKI